MTISTHRTGPSSSSRMIRTCGDSLPPQRSIVRLSNRRCPAVKRGMNATPRNLAAPWRSRLWAIKPVIFPHWTRFVVLLWVPISACSSARSNDPPAPVGNGGTDDGRSGAAGASAGIEAGGAVGANAGAGNAAAGTGDSGSGGTPATINVALATEACRGYIQAWCDRRVECDVWDEAANANCLANQEQCPDRFFIPGSGYTLDGLNACAETWSTYPCEQVVAGEDPECVAQGALGDGESCRFSLQCESAICSAWLDDGCGVCVSAVPSGSACEITPQCPEAHLCHQGHCLELQDYPIQDSLADGEPCEYDGRCLGLCAPTADGDRCVPAPDPGDPCLPQGPKLGARRCEKTQYCSLENICTPLPGPDEPCAPGLLQCRSAHYCERASGGAPGTCRPWLELGATCTPRPNEHACNENTACLCIDASCETGVCAYLGGTANACDAGQVCPTGTDCRAGFCMVLHQLQACAL